MESPVVQKDSSAPVPEIQPEGDPGRIFGPEGKGPRADPDSEAGGPGSFVHQEVPRHHAGGIVGAPLEIAIGAFPGVAEEEGVFGKASVPAQKEKVQWSPVGGDFDFQAVVFRSECKRDILKRHILRRSKDVLPAFRNQRDLIRKIQFECHVKILFSDLVCDPDRCGTVPCRYAGTGDLVPYSFFPRFQVSGCFLTVSFSAIFRFSGKILFPPLDKW